MNVIDYGMSPQNAGDQPRAENDSEVPVPGGQVNLERGISDEVRQKLADLGHNIGKGYGVFGGYQGIWREEKPLRYFGGSDPRKDGCAVGW
jgi:gamma-glutamyltranspeptidase/glutathione hydrolase